MTAEEDETINQGSIKKKEGFMKSLAPFVVAAAVVLATALAYAGEWTGQIVKKDGKYWFKSGEKTYSITNPEKAAGHEGQTVKVTGTAGQKTNSVKITKVTPVDSSSSSAPSTPSKKSSE